MATFVGMAKSKKKYYVVWEGNETGVFDSWEKCQLSVKGFPNAKYKAYSSKEEAEAALSHFPGWERKPGGGAKNKVIDPDRTGVDQTAMAVDAACSGNPGDMEYRGVWVNDGTEIFRKGPFTQGTNNIGEFLAIVHALAFLKQQGDTNTRIYTDSRTAIKWVKMKKANTQLKPGRANATVFEFIRRAEHWLKENSYRNPIEKWDTERWGEIPADFGRK